MFCHNTTQYMHSNDPTELCSCLHLDWFRRYRACPDIRPCFTDLDFLFVRKSLSFDVNIYPEAVFSNIEVQQPFGLRSKEFWPQTADFAPHKQRITESKILRSATNTALQHLDNFCAARNDGTAEN